MPVAVLSPRRGYLKLIKEVTRGTPLGTTISMPVHQRTLQGKWARIKPDYMNNSVYVQREVDAGRKQAEGDISGPVTSVEFGHVLQAMFGNDAITGSGPYVHTFNPVTAQPSYTIEKNAGGLVGASQSEQFSNSICTKLTIRGNVEKDDAVLDYTSTWRAKAPTLITPTAFTMPITKEIPAALTAFQYPIATPVNDLLANFEITFERESEFIKGANNSLDISDVVGAGFRVLGFVDLYFVDYTYYSDFVANTQRSIDIKTQLTASDILEFKMTQLFWDDENLEEGQTFLKRRFPFTGTYDNTITGPVNVILTNNQSTAF